MKDIVIVGAGKIGSMIAEFLGGSGDYAVTVVDRSQAQLDRLETSAPIKKAGKTVKLKGKTLMLSPANYRLQVQISVDGGPYTNFGNPWFRKTEGQ